jgi:hypothetical protein
LASQNKRLLINKEIWHPAINTILEDYLRVIGVEVREEDIGDDDSDRQIRKFPHFHQ